MTGALSGSHHSTQTPRRHSACGVISARTTSASALRSRLPTAIAWVLLRGATWASPSGDTLQAEDSMTSTISSKSGWRSPADAGHGAVVSIELSQPTARYGG